MPQHAFPEFLVVCHVYRLNHQYRLLSSWLTIKAKGFLGNLEEQIATYGKTEFELLERNLTKLAGLTDQETAKIRAAITEFKNLKEADEIQDITKTLDDFFATEANREAKRRHEIDYYISKLEIAGGLSRDEAENLRKQAEYIHDGTVELAKRLNDRYMSPDDTFRQQAIGYGNALAVGFIGTDTYAKALADLRNEHLRLKADAGNTWAAHDANVLVRGEYNPAYSCAGCSDSARLR